MIVTIRHKLVAGIISLIAAAVLLPLLAGFAENCFTQYRNEQYNYSITLPASWTINDLNLDSRHLMLAAKDTSTEIKVRAFKSSSNIEKLASDNSWQLRHIDPFLNKIIETEKITIRKKTAKLLVFEYRSNRQKILQRTMITRNGEFLYIIECKSPARSFYRNEKIFNIAMSSFSYISGKEEPQNGESAGEQSIDTGKSIEQLEKSAGGDKRKSNGDEKFFELE